MRGLVISIAVDISLRLVLHSSQVCPSLTRHGPRMACMRPTGSCNFVSENFLKMFWRQSCSHKLRWSMLLRGHTPPAEPKAVMESAGANNCPKEPGVQSFTGWALPSVKTLPFARREKKTVFLHRIRLVKGHFPYQGPTVRVNFETISGPFGPCKSRGARLPCSLIKLNQLSTLVVPLATFQHTHPLP